MGVQPSLQKFSAFPVGQIISTSSPVSSHRGAARDRHRRGAGRGGRDSVGAQSWWEGGPIGIVGNSQRADERRGRGRRSRVVLTPRRWRQVSRRRFTPNRVVTRQYPRSDGGKR